MAAVTLERPEGLKSEASTLSVPRKKPRLRVGLIADSRYQPRWLARAFTGVAASDVAEIAVIAELGVPPAMPPWPWRAYRDLDHRVFGRGEDLLQPTDLAQALARADVQKLDAVNADACAQLRAHDLDIAFVLGEIPAGALADVARYGVWRYGFGPHGATPAGAAAIRETIEGAPLTASALLARLPGDYCERVLCRSWSRTFPLSLSRTWRGLLPKTSEFVLRALTRLHAAGPEWIAECDRAGAASEAAAPDTADCLRHLARLAPNIASRALQRLLFVDQWFIGFRFGDERDWHGDLRRFRLLMPPTDRFWADPFPIERCGRHFIFFEELVFSRGKAHISVMEVNEDGRWSPPVPVLERDYHLSYPFLIEHGGELYMVPETGHNRTVELYRCTSFPDRWRLEKVLLEDVCSADATLHQSAGKWWMFVGLFAEGSEFNEGAEELHVFHADDLLDKWQPHAANPVKSDVRSARPAGALFSRDGALYRPAQIGVPLYGSGVSINRVLRLTPDEYLEREVQQILPRHPGNVLGLHTVNRAGRFSVIDGFARNRRI